ncbi:MULTISPECIES: hypothetical protein [Bacillus]|uniref:hypothetical protein n=1 Tax=Bacillus TaxID=1386 RepID=UPI0005CE7BE5|nr:MULTISPECIES: hypothetical protein [Bacillus]KJE30833.1 hypothetical protein LG49_343 [Bacillus licheniformis]MCY8373213.1 hypothetical protein [Bacillus haynesii]MCY8673121.1 hypothetical protein [Bacillus haynesii]OAZ60210.1 hypothetical protein SRCM100115_04270 [Bacillus licheniformis]TWM95670.1 hypothetical protein CHCC14596_1643 [Bacillus licheniformis]
MSREEQINKRTKLMMDPTDLMMFFEYITQQSENKEELYKDFFSFLSKYTEPVVVEVKDRNTE